MESPEKVNSLERNKRNLLQSQIHSLDNAVYGGTNSYNQTSQNDYNSFSKNAPKFTPLPARPPSYTPDSKTYSPTTTSPSYQSPYKQLPTSPTKPTFAYSPKPSNLTTFGSDGYTTSEYKTNTYKIPGGYKTDSYKYEAYKSSTQPTYTAGTEKYYTSTPNAKVELSPFDKKTFETFSNGDNQYQSSYSSNVEYINEPPVLKDTDTLEQKMLKKSVTQQIIEKKTVQMTKSSKQESSTKSFRFE